MTEENTPYHDAHDILPDEECIVCAEKHYSFAMQLANEIGYIPINRQKIIGELVASQWHTHKYDEKLAGDIRDIRHYVQERTEDLIDWKPLCVRFEELITKDKEETLNKLNEALDWAKSLIGDSALNIDPAKLNGAHLGFLAEKNKRGGCSSCRLKRLKRKYRNLLPTLI